MSSTAGLFLERTGSFASGGPGQWLLGYVIVSSVSPMLSTVYMYGAALNVYMAVYMMCYMSLGTQAAFV